MFIEGATVLAHIVRHEVKSRKQSLSLSTEV